MQLTRQILRRRFYDKTGWKARKKQIPPIKVYTWTDAYVHHLESLICNQWTEGEPEQVSHRDEFLIVGLVAKPLNPEVKRIPEKVVVVAHTYMNGSRRYYDRNSVEFEVIRHLRLTAIN